MKLTNEGIEYFKQGLRMLYSDKTFKGHPLEEELKHTRDNMDYAIDYLQQTEDITPEIKDYNTQAVNTINELLYAQNKKFKEEFKINYLANYILNNDCENSQLYNAAYETTLEKFK